MTSPSYYIVCAFACLVWVLPVTTLGAQELTRSNLPILEFGVARAEIPDEPKVATRLRIVYNGPGVENLNGGPTLDYEGEAAIEVRGSTSQSLFPKNSFGFELRDADGSDRDASLLGMPAEEDWVLHGPYSDKTLIRNAFTYSLAGELMPYAPRVRLVEVTFAGQYEGVYVLTERIKRDEHRVDIARLDPTDVEGDALTGGYIIKVDKATGEDFSDATDWRAPQVALPGAIRTPLLYHYPKPADLLSPQRRYIRGFIEEFERRLAAPDWRNPVTGYRPLIDQESFVDFLLINEVTRNVDGYRLSTYLYKDRDSRGGRLHMGPVWDFNLALANANYCGGARTSGWAYDFNRVCPGDGFQAPFWYQRLMGDPIFQSAVRARYFALRQNGPFADEALLGRIDSLRAELEQGAQQRNFTRWPVLGEYIWPNDYVERDYDDGVRRVRKWLQQRMAWLDQEMSGLSGAEDTLAWASATLVPNPGGAVAHLRGVDLAQRPVTITWYDVRGAPIAQQVQDAPQLELQTPSRPGLYFWQATHRGTLFARGRWLRR